MTFWYIAYMVNLFVVPLDIAIAGKHGKENKFEWMNNDPWLIGPRFIIPPVKWKLLGVSIATHSLSQKKIILVHYLSMILFLIIKLCPNFGSLHTLSKPLEVQSSIKCRISHRNIYQKYKIFHISLQQVVVAVSVMLSMTKDVISWLKTQSHLLVI